MKFERLRYEIDMSRLVDRLTLPEFDAGAELDAGSTWLRERLRDAGRGHIVIGLSGGIDSAVTATWAARALGTESLILVAMPYGLLTAASFGPSARDSLAHGRLVAAQLAGADYRELDIAPSVDAEAETNGLAAELQNAPQDLRLQSALANVKARMRAVRLRYFTNRYDALLLGTENRTEHYLGYFTTGGDEESDLELLGNYLKAEVGRLALTLGVPSEIIEKPPSADLWAGQTDEGELGFSYRDADHVLYMTGCRTELSSDTAARCAVDLEIASRVLARVRATDFKRAAKPVFPRGEPTR